MRRRASLLFSLRRQWWQRATPQPPSSAHILCCRLYHESPRRLAALSSSSDPAADTTATAHAWPSAVGLTLAPPSAFSHAALSVVACPVCGATQGLEGLFQHLVTVHSRDHPMATYQSLCRARLALYEEAVGRPLMTAEERRLCGVDSALAPSEAAARAASPQHPSQFSTTGSYAPVPAGGLATGSEHDIDWRLQLPTITASGYVCNWCVVRSVFHTRDALLLHVCHDHPRLDVEAVEGLVPALPHRRAADRASTSGRESGWGREDALSTSSRGLLATRRILPGAFDRGGHAEAAAQAEGNRQPGLFLRAQKGVSLPRGADDAVHAESDGQRTSGQSLDFAADCFPCELCQRSFTVEVGLLNHLLTCHTHAEKDCDEPVDVDTDATSGDREAAVQDIAQVMKREARLQRRHSHGPASSGGVTGALPIRCDLCGRGSKVYTLPSALFAHIRFKHPREDAAFHVDRLLRAAQHTQQQQQHEAQRAARGVHRDATLETTPTSERANAAQEMLFCAFCRRVFSSSQALSGHMSDKHGVTLAMNDATPTNSTTTTGKSSVASASATAQPALAPATPKTMWWCSPCEKGFASARALVAHAVGKHARPLEALPCPACKRICPDVYALEDHMKSTHPTLPFNELGLRDEDAICAVCCRRFLSQDELRAHVARHHATVPAAEPRETAPPSAPVLPNTPAELPAEPIYEAHVGGAAHEPSFTAPATPRKVAKRAKRTG